MHTAHFRLLAVVLFFNVSSAANSEITFPTAFTANTVFVDAKYGNDATGLRERRDFPFQTLSKALTVAQVGDNVEIFTDLTFSGSVTVNIANLSFDFHGHKIIGANQTDSKKLQLDADGITVRHLEASGLWDGASTSSGTGAVIFTHNKQITLEDVFVHDTIDEAIHSDGDFSGDNFRNIRIDNCRLTGLSINAQNTATYGAEFSAIRVTNSGGKGIAIANGGAGTKSLYGMHLRGFYLSNTGEEALYTNGWVDSTISDGSVEKATFNISVQSSDHLTINNVTTRGGKAGQYCGLELPYCKNITVTNSTFDGTARNGTTNPSGANSFGIVASTVGNPATVAGNFVFSNVISKGYTCGIGVASVKGVTISGGNYTGIVNGISISYSGDIQVTGAYVTGNPPIAIDSGSSYTDTDPYLSQWGFNRNLKFEGNFFRAVSGSPAEIYILSQDSSDTISGVTIKNNTRLDSISLTELAVAQHLGNGTGVISNLLVSGNQGAGWPETEYPKFRASRNNASGQSIPDGTWTKVILPYVTIDTNGAFSNSSFTCPIAGFYEFAAQGGLDTAASGIKFQLGLYINGTNVLDAQPYVGSYGSGVLDSGPFYLNVGDIIELWVRHEAGSSTVLRNPGYDFFFSGQRLP